MRCFKPDALRRTLAALALSAFSMFAALSSRAITARDVTDKMSEEER